MMRLVQGEVYKNNQFVFVRGEDTPKDKDTEGRPKDFWVARILQVRAKNAQHVYALVSGILCPAERLCIDYLGGMDVLGRRTSSTASKSPRSTEQGFGKEEISRQP